MTLPPPSPLVATLSTGPTRESGANATFTVALSHATSSLVALPLTVTDPTGAWSSETRRERRGEGGSVVEFLLLGARKSVRQRNREKTARVERIERCGNTGVVCLSV